MNISQEREGLQVTAGYDRRLNYAFMVLASADGEIVYSNLYEPNPHEIQDFDYFEKIAKEKFDLDLWDISDAIKVFKINTQ